MNSVFVPTKIFLDTYLVYPYFIFWLRRCQWCKSRQRPAIETFLILIDASFCHNTPNKLFCSNQQCIYCLYVAFDVAYMEYKPSILSHFTPKQLIFIYKHVQFALAF